MEELISLKAYNANLQFHLINDIYYKKSVQGFKDLNEYEMDSWMDNYKITSEIKIDKIHIGDSFVKYYKNNKIAYVFNALKGIDDRGFNAIQLHIPDLDCHNGANWGGTFIRSIYSKVKQFPMYHLQVLKSTDIHK